MPQVFSFFHALLASRSMNRTLVLPPFLHLSEANGGDERTEQVENRALVVACTSVRSSKYFLEHFDIQGVDVGHCLANLVPKCASCTNVCCLCNLGSADVALVFGVF